MHATVVAIQTQELAPSSTRVKDCAGWGEMGVFSQPCKPGTKKLRKSVGRLMALSVTYFQGSAMDATREWRDGLCFSDTFSNIDSIMPSIYSADISTLYRGYTNNPGAVVSLPL